MDIIHGSVDMPDCALRYAAVTDKGLVRRTNEDNYLVLSGVPLFCVADGAGGHADGAFASQLTLQSIRHIFRFENEKMADETTSLADDTMPVPIFSPEKSGILLEAAVKYANSVVFGKNNDRKIASTVVACHFEERRIHITHVGDSRLYVFREDEIRLLTEDHSLVNMLYRQGDISLEECRTHPKRNVITRAIGMEEEVAVSVTSIDYQPSDYFLLCSDGLTSMMDDEEIFDIFKRYMHRITECCQALIEEANNNGGRDNTTVILIRVC